MKVASIYALFDPRDSALRYIGMAVNPLARLRDHVREAKKGGGSHRLNWIRSVLKDGTTPQVSILESVTSDTWSERERWHIASLRRLGFKLVNGTDGGEGSLGHVTSEETKRLLSLSHLGKKLTPEHNAKLQAAALKTNLGAKRSSETRLLQSKSATARYQKPGAIEAHAEQQRENLSKPETRAKMSESARRRLGQNQRNEFGRFRTKERNSNGRRKEGS